MIVTDPNIKPSEIRTTKLEGTNPPVTKVAKDALREALAAGRGSEITGVNWKEVESRSFAEKLSAVFGKKAAAGNEQSYVEQINAERAAAAQTEIAAPQNAGEKFSHGVAQSAIKAGQAHAR